MSQGLRFFMVKYPGFIAIADGTRFTFEVDGLLVIVVVVRKSLPVRINEYNNELLEKPVDELESHIMLEFKKPIDSTFHEKSQVLTQAEFYYIIEYEPPERYRTITNQYYTDLYIKFEVDNTNNENERNDKFWKYLNHFLNAYRIATGDIKIQLASTYHSKEILTHERCWKYDNDDLILEPEARMNSVKRMGILKMPLVELSLGDFRKNESKATYPIEENTNKLLNYILEEEHGFWSIDILLKAKEELYHNHNYRYALLDAFIFIESITSQFIDEIKIAKGISKRKLKEMEREVGISYKINIELPLILENLSLHEKDILRMVDGTRSIRNNVVHKGANVTKAQAEEAIQGAERLMDVLMKRKTNS